MVCCVVSCLLFSFLFGILACLVLLLLSNGFSLRDLVPYKLISGGCWVL